MKRRWGVSSMKHLKDMPGADSVKKKGLVFNEIDIMFNKLSVKMKIISKLTSAFRVSAGHSRQNDNPGS